jgi:hypothetical protein
MIVNKLRGLAPSCENPLPLFHVEQNELITTEPSEIDRRTNPFRGVRSESKNTDRTE